MRYELIDDTLTIFLTGELNSSNAEDVGLEIERIAKSVAFQTLVLDLKDLSYISSAGLRIVLRLKNTYADFSIVNASNEVYEIFHMTGFTSILTVKKALRNIDITGASVIGDGYYSTVYQLDKDTVVKVFNQTSDEHQIERELRLAKEAFVLGIPTAISFDIVQVGEKLGVCYEMLDCMSLKDALLSHPDRKKDYYEKYASLLKVINSTECLNPSIPEIKKTYQKKVEEIAPFLEKRHYEKAKALIDSIEERHTFVHGDCHFKNIMVQDEELLLIDMDTLSVGHPIFELAAIYDSYCGYNEDSPGNCEAFFGISEEEAREIYESVVALYFGKDDAAIKEKIKLVCYINIVWDHIHAEGSKEKLEKAKHRLVPLLERYDDLDIDR